MGRDLKEPGRQKGERGGSGTLGDYLGKGRGEKKVKREGVKHTERRGGEAAAAVAMRNIERAAEVFMPGYV